MTAKVQPTIKPKKKKVTAFDVVVVLLMLVFALIFIYPLWTIVVAAFSDPVFPPLEAGELDYVTIGVSLVSAPRRLASPEDADPARDGLLLVAGTRRAVFLPRIVAEQRWTPAEAWSNLARKAGLAADAWQSPEVELYAFGCEDFSE